MVDREKVIKGLECHAEVNCVKCPYLGRDGWRTCPFGETLLADALFLLKEQELPTELKQKMWNTFYAEEDEYEKKFVGKEEHHNWFSVYRPWLQEGFNIAIKAIAEWEGR